MGSVTARAAVGLGKGPCPTGSQGAWPAHRCAPTGRGSPVPHYPKPSTTRLLRWQGCRFTLGIPTWS